MSCSLVSIYSDSTQPGKQQKQTVTILDYWSRDMLNFHFIEKGLGIVFSPHFVYDFSRKMFLMLWFINWPNFIVWLPLLLEILGNICIEIVYFPGCDVINLYGIILIDKLIWSPKSSRFYTRPGSQDKM